VHLTSRGGNRVGALVGNGEQSFRVPALGGRAHARAFAASVTTRGLRLVSCIRLCHDIMTQSA